MATMTPAQFSDKVQILVRTGKLGQVLAAVAADASLAMERGAKRRTTGGRPLHVRTGKLRQSIKPSTTVKGNTVTAEIQAGGRRAYYARFHEFGEGRNHKRPFLAPARESAIKGLDATLTKRVRQALRTVGIGT